MDEGSIPQLGGCQCGAIRYQLDGKPEYVSYCHCVDCRKATGALMVTYAVHEIEQVHFNGERKTYTSTPGVQRTFCPACGTPLSYEAEWQGRIVIGVFVGTLDNADALPPEMHVFDIDRVSWFDVADHLPRYHQHPFSETPVRYGPVGST